MHPPPTISDDPTICALGSESKEYNYDNSVVQASLIVLFIQFVLAVVIAVLFGAIRFSTGDSVIACSVVGCVCVEFGLGLFLCHCIFLFPRESPSRFLGAAGSVVIASVQLAPASEGYALGPLFIFVVGISITGWILHRFVGASLSMNGADVFQNALGTKVLLLIAPLLLLLGIVPIITFTAMTGEQLPRDFAPLIVYASLGMLGTSVIPILTIYFGFFLLRLRAGWSFAVIVLLFISAVSPMILEWLAFSRVSNSVWTTVSVLCYIFGLGIAYLPFHLRGFRPVWAKRKHKPSVESSVSFDDIK